MLNAIETAIKELAEKLKRTGVKEIKYTQGVEGWRTIEVNGDDITAAPFPDPQTEQLIDDIDLLYSMLSHEKKIPPIEDEGVEVSTEVYGITFKVELWA